MTITTAASQYTSYQEAMKTPQGRQKFWVDAVIAAEKELNKFHDRGNKIVGRYLGTSDDSQPLSPRHFNLFHSNVNIMKAALYAKIPQPEVMRRYKDPDDDVARVAALILERNLQYELQNSEDYDEVFKNVILDRLLPGMGVCWQRYEAETAIGDLQVGTTEIKAEVIEKESTPIDYVYWQDLLWAPSRTWREVWWVARKVYLTKDEGMKRFGDKFSKVQMDREVKSTMGTEALSMDLAPKNQTLKRGCVYEIWNKRTRKVCWISKYVTEPLDEKDDFLHLPAFFPTPKPLFASLTTSNMIPMADYMLCQDQYEELDVINTRISYLIQACKVVGVYDKRADGLQRMLNQAVENQLIAVDQWAAFAEKGGLKGSVDWLPVEQVAAVIQQLNLAREQIKQQIYELTGLADVIRGASKASETAAAQEIKAQYASVRLTTQQQEVATFLSEVFQAKSCLMCYQYQPEKLLKQAGTIPEVDQQLIEPALKLLKNEYESKFRIKVSVDTFTDVDWQRERQERIDFLMSAGQFVEKAAMAAEQAPESVPMMFGLLKFAVSGFRAAREVEGYIDQGAQATAQAIAQRQANPQPDPEQQKIQAEMQQSQQEFQLKTQEMQAKMQRDREEGQMKLQQMMEEHQLEMQQMREKHQMEMQVMMAKVQGQIQVEQIKTQAKAEQAQMDGAIKMQEAEINAEVQERQGEQQLEHDQQTHEQNMEQAAQAHAQGLKQKKAEAKVNGAGKAQK